MKTLLKSTILLAALCTGGLHVQAQEETSGTRKADTPSFSAEVGIGANLLPNYGQMLSPQGGITATNTTR